MRPGLWVVFIFCVAQHGIIEVLSLSFHSNRYDDLLVAISPSIPENKSIISNIQAVVTEASPYLFTATRNRAYFGAVKILVPGTWSHDPSWVFAGSETFDDADVRIDVEHPVFQNDAYTFQPGGCGEPGKYIHLTEHFILDPENDNVANYGPTGRVFVHEFAHLRYGVFDEYGTGTSQYPNFYIEDGTSYPTACVDGLKGNNFPEDKCREVNETTNLPSPDCFFVASQTLNTVPASVMYDTGIDSVTMFCESSSDDPDLAHNMIAPSPQNKLCENQGTWDVIKKHADFNGANRPVNKTDVALRPTFTVMQSPGVNTQGGGTEAGGQGGCGRPVVLVLDVSGSMKGERIFKQRQTADKFIQDLMPKDGKLGIVEFSSTPMVVQQLTPLHSQQDRDRASSNIPSKAGGGTGIGLGLLAAKQMLTNQEGGRIILITDGEENVAPNVVDVITSLVASNIKVHAVAYSSAAAQSIQQLTHRTGGTYAYYSESASNTQLDSAMEVVMKDISLCKAINRMQVKRAAVVVSAGTELRGQFLIDRTLNKDTMVVFTLPQNVLVQVSLVSPSGTLLDAHSPAYSYDSSLAIVRYNIKEAESGSWRYILRSQGSGTVVVLVKALPSEESPYEIDSWLSSSLADLSSSAPPAVVYVHVHKRYSPVVDADVKVTVERPSGGPVALKPRDNGQPPDNMADDGVYSGYFTEYTDNNRYSLDVDVQNIPGKTRVVGGTPLIGRSPSRFHNTTKPVKSVIADNFTRSTSPGALDVHGFVSGKDQIPPDRVVDLLVKDFDAKLGTVTLTWTATGDDATTGTVKNNILRIAQTAALLRKDFEHQLIVTSSMLVKGSLTPHVAPTTEEITIKLPSGWTKASFALKAIDDGGHVSKMSNPVSVTLKKALMYGSTPPHPPPADDDDDTGIVIAGAAIGGFVFGLVVVCIVIAVIKNKNSAKNAVYQPENPFDAPMTEPTVPVKSSRY